MMMRFFFGSLSAALLSGCASMEVMSHMPLTTMSRLAGMTMDDIDPSSLRVAARLPERLAPRPRGVKIVLDIGGALGATHEEFILEPETAAAELELLAGNAQRDSKLWVYRLSSSDVTRLRQIIDRSRGARASSVSIAAGVDACHLAPLGQVALPTTTFLRTNATGYFVVTENLDLRAIVPEADLVSKIPACA